MGETITSEAASRAPEPALVAGAGFVGGVLAASTAPSLPPAATALAASVAAVAAIGIAPARWRRAARLAALLLAGASAALVRLERVAPNDISRRPGPRAALVRLVGTVADAPAQVREQRDRLRPPDRMPRWRFDFHPERAIAGDGRSTPVSGCVEARADFRPPVRAGERIELTGRHVRPQRVPRNPGERGGPPGISGWIFVETPALVRRVDPIPIGVRRTLGDLVRAVRSAADLALARGFTSAPRTARAGLLATLVLGRTSPSATATMDAIRRTGLAHLFAISGLHLGIVAGMALLPRRVRGVPRRRDAAWLALALVGYLLLVEPRAPVLRAGAGLGLVAIGLACGVAFRPRGLLGLAALLLAACDPRGVATPGFQLSFVVVLALVQFGTPPPDPYAWIGGARARRRRIMRVLRPPVVAWLASLPLLAHHFGAVPLLAVPLGIVAMPMVVALLVGGLAKIATGLAAGAGLPIADALDAHLVDALDLGLRLIAALAHGADRLPGSSVQCPTPGAAWTIAALAWIALVLARGRRLPIVPAIATSIALALPLLPPRPPAHLRLDVLDVADGTCHLVRRGSATMLVDAGSARDRDAGRRVIVPALRALGVRRLDRIVVTHADLDHYAALGEIVESWPPREVVLPLGFAGAPDRPELGAKRVLDLLRSERIPVRYVRDGARIALGDATATVLHPRDVDDGLDANDRSCALLVESDGRSLALLGDLEREGLARLRGRHPGLRADVLELPHHGAFTPAALELVRDLSPRVLVQSTGPRRLDPDGWTSVAPLPPRLVTARDGALSVELRPDRIRAESVRGRSTIRP